MESYDRIESEMLIVEPELQGGCAADSRKTLSRLIFHWQARLARRPR
jgi:hypothetical protein